MTCTYFGTVSLLPKQSSWITSSNTMIALCFFLDCFASSSQWRILGFTSLRGPFARSNPVELPHPIRSLRCVFFLDCFASSSQWRILGFTSLRGPFTRSNPVDLPPPIRWLRCFFFLDCFASGSQWRTIGFSSLQALSPKQFSRVTSSYCTIALCCFM